MHWDFSEAKLLRRLAQRFGARVDLRLVARLDRFLGFFCRGLDLIGLARVELLGRDPADVDVEPVMNARVVMPAD